MAKLSLPILSIVVVTGSLVAQEPRKEDPPSLKRYVGVYTKTLPENQVILEKPVVRKLGDRQFMVGHPTIYDKINIRLTTNDKVLRWIALEEIIEFYELDDARNYQDNGRPPR